GVVEGGQSVADVVKQRAHEVLVVATVPLGSRRRLQRVLETIDREPAVVVAEVAQLLEDPIGDHALRHLELGHDGHPVLLGGLVEALERGSYARGRHRSSVLPSWGWVLITTLPAG